MARRVALVAAVLLCACSVELALPENVLVTCENGACPDGFHCNNARLCVPSSSDDSTAPVVVDAAYDADAVGAGRTITLTMTVSEPLLIDPVVRFTSNGAVRAFTRVAATAADTPLYVFAYTTAGDETEGAQTTTAEILDLVGNTNTVILPSIVIDFTPATIIDGSTLLELTPDRATNPLAEVSAISGGTRVQVSFAVDERLPQAPTLAFGSALTLPMEQLSATVFAFDRVWVAGDLVDGTYDVIATLTDAAGNVSDVTLALAGDATPRGFVIDSVPPAPPAVDQPGVISLRRAPWARVSTTPALPSTAVVGVASGVEAGARVVAYPQASLPACASATCRFSSYALAVGTADATGAFALDLGSLDRQRVYVAAVDDAGNASDLDVSTAGLQVSRVRDGVLDIAFAGEEGNPNAFTLTDTFPPLLGDIVDSPADGADVATIDAAVVATTGGFTWLTSDIPAAPAVSALEPPAATHPRLGQLVALTGEMALLDNVGLRTINPSPAPALDMNGVRLAYDLASDAILYYGGGLGGAGQYNRTWLWNGAQWRRVCTATSCVDASPRRRQRFALASDPNRRVVVLVGGQVVEPSEPDKALYVWEWDGNAWTAKCTDAACNDPVAGNGPDPGILPTATFDPHLNEVLLLTASTTESQTWSWDGTRWLRRCVGCASTPPPRAGASMTYDGAHDEVVLYGGTAVVCSSSFRFDTWTWDGSAWTLRSDPSGLPGAMLRGMAYDPRRRQVTMFGGHQPICGPGTPPSETDSQWDWDGQTWRRRRGVGQRDLVALGYDPVHASLFGESADGDVRWNGVEWTEPDYPTVGAVGALVRSSYAAGARLVFFDGSSTRTLEPAGWQFRCVGAASCGLPLPASSYSIASDGVNATFAGGRDGSNADILGVWRFNGTSWTSVCASCGSHIGSVMVYGGAPGELYSIVGSTTPLSPAFLHRFSGGGFTLSDALPGTSFIVYSAAIFDSHRNAFSWVGGGTPGSMGSLTPRTTFQYHGAAGWQAQPPLSLPSEPMPAVQPLAGLVAGYDDGLAQTVILPGDGSYTVTYSGAADRPAHILSMPIGESIETAGFSLADFDLDWYGTATSDDHGVAVTDVTTWVWNVDRWTDVQATMVAPGHWRATVSAATFGVNGRLDRLQVGAERRITAAITPRAANGQSTAGASLTTDAVGVTFHYRLD
ncbi:MAG TPA: hypothetical protein VLC93_09325 [Myxococcota bacterium]|nr:hypothetical protein [Myxococcota bacterium]